MSATTANNVQIAEEFLAKLRNHDYLISPVAETIFINSTRYRDPHMSLATGLANAMADYEAAKALSPSPSLMQAIGVNPAATGADILVIWINKAFAHGCILENRDRISSITAAKDKEIEKLVGEKASLLAQLEEVKRDRDSIYDANGKLAYELAEANGKIKLYEEKFRQIVPSGDDVDV